MSSPSTLAPAPQAPSPAALAAAARTRLMLEAPPLRLLVRMASPNALAFLVQASVSMVEAWYIGRLGTASLAAIALVFPGLMLMQMLSGGAMGGAVTSAIARSLGAGQHERAQRLIWHALAIGVLAGAFFAAAWWLGGRALLLRLGAHDEVLVDALLYGNLLFTGCVLVWLSSLLNAVFRGMGDMQYPATLMLVGAAIQVPLSGVLVLGAFGVPSLGILGAAVSVLVVALVSTLLQLRRLASGKANLALRVDLLRFEWHLFRDILRVGALVFGLGASMTSLVGVNIGAGQVARAERIGWIGAGCAAALTGGVGLLLALVPGLWMDLFTDDPATIAAGAAYLRIAGVAFLFQGLGLSLYFASQGAGAVFWPVVGTVVRFVVSVGGAYLAVRHFGTGLEGVYACIAAGMVLYGLITAASLYLGTWRRGAQR
jgi:Na+-driven multidrug efflux pump